MWIKKKLQMVKKWENFTLGQRIGVLTFGVVFTLGLILIIFINSIAPIFITYEIGSPDTQLLQETINAEGTPVTILVNIPAPENDTVAHDVGFIRADPITVVNVLSVIGLVSIAGLGIFASKWVAKISLQPFQQISKTAQYISIHHLDQRLNYQGREDEVKILADSFDLMLQRLQINFKDQSQFISNVAHELRTPLTSLRMNLEVLNSDTQATLNDYMDFSEMAERSINRLESLVENLLLLAKAEKEVIHHQFLLGVILEEIIYELLPLAEENDIELKMMNMPEAILWGEPVLLQHALINLIENGIRYNHPGGFVKITSKEENNLAVIEIRDNGLGISEEQQVHLFERFYQVRSKTRETDHGTGLGLAITNHVIKLHKGKIELESEIGKGSLFRVFLPVAKSDYFNKSQNTETTTPPAE